MSILLSIHEPWHFQNWEPVLRHMQPGDAQLHVSTWSHRGTDPIAQQKAIDHTLAWMQEKHGLSCLSGPLREEPHVMGTLAIDGRMVGQKYSKQIRMLYAVISKQYTYSELNKVYDCILVASTFGKNLLAKHNVRAEVVGYPKLDDVFNGVLTRESARKELGIGPEEKVVLYAPTLGSMCTVERYGAAFAKLDPSITLLCQLHPCSYIAERHRFEHLPERMRWISEDDAGLATLVAADVVVTDYSGVTFEACAIDRPVVLLDDPAIETTEDVERFYRDAGPQVFEAQQLIEAIESSLAQPEKFSERREYYRHTFYEYHGQAGKRAADALLELEKEARTARERDIDRIYTKMRVLESRMAVMSR